VLYRQLKDESFCNRNLIIRSSNEYNSISGSFRWIVALYCLTQFL